MGATAMTRRTGRSLLTNWLRYAHSAELRTIAPAQRSLQEETARVDLPANRSLYSRAHPPERLSRPSDSMIKGIKGVKDILPEETPRWRFIEESARRWADRHGFREIRIPIF